MLYVVATPIGNLGDLTLRAIEVLKAADFIVAENPTHTGKLLKHFGIQPLPTLSSKGEGKPRFMQLADFNEERSVPKIVERLKAENGCLVSDAGTPGISDPGFKLVRACREAGIEVVSIPGPSAAIAALSVSGLPTDKFLFVGFLPKTEPKITKAIEEARSAEATLIAYESPQRIKKTIEFIAKTFPSARVVITRELTKLHEEYIGGSVEEVKENLKNRDSIKGEIVLLISFK